MHKGTFFRVNKDTNKIPKGALYLSFSPFEIIEGRHELKEEVGCGDTVKGRSLGTGVGCHHSEKAHTIEKMFSFGGRSEMGAC